MELDRKDWPLFPQSGLKTLPADTPRPAIDAFPGYDTQGAKPKPAKAGLHSL